MKTLPKTWFVDIKNVPVRDVHLLDKFKKWFKEKGKGRYDFSLKYYGKSEGVFSCWDYACNTLDLITLQDWNEMVFGLNEQFEKGEEVLVRDHESEGWDNAIFIAEFEGNYLTKWCGYFETFCQCKKKLSELDIKIEELKKLAEEKGVKLTIIAE